MVSFVGHFNFVHATPCDIKGFFDTLRNDRRAELLFIVIYYLLYVPLYFATFHDLQQSPTVLW